MTVIVVLRWWRMHSAHTPTAPTHSPVVGNPGHSNIPAAYLGDIWDVLQNISARLP